MRRVLRGAFLNTMEKYYPSYYNEFSCLAGECPDSCCTKWEIVIDECTLNKYNALSTDFGNEVLSQIIKDEEGDCCFLLNNGRCPFLNSHNLCDIHIKLGEDFTSEICRNHPRFIEEYDGFTEISLSLSCPEANRIIMSSEKSVYPTPLYKGDDEVLELLISSREKLLSSDLGFSSLIKLLLDAAADDSLDIDLVYIENHPDINVAFLKNLASFLLRKSEILTNEWKAYLENAEEVGISDEEFEAYCKSNDEALIKICRYFIYRYYLKAVNDLDIYSRALFIAFSCLFPAFIACSCNVTLWEAARLFSKETEHNLFNLDLLLGFFSEF